MLWVYLEESLEHGSFRLVMLSLSLPAEKMHLVESPPCAMFINSDSFFRRQSLSIWGKKCNLALSNRMSIMTTHLNYCLSLAMLSFFSPFVCCYLSIPNEHERG